MPDKIPRRVLIVDDDESLANALAARLALVCDEVKIAPTIRETLVVLQTIIAPAVLLDLALPDSMVSETLATIPEMIARGARKIVIITGTIVNPDTEALALRYGAKDIIGKGDAGFLEKLVKFVSSD